MPALQAPKKISRRQELRQDAVVTVYARALDFYSNNKAYVLAAAAVLAVVVIGFVGYRFYLTRQSDEASKMLGPVVLMYERGDYQEALDGTATDPGLIEIAARYGQTTDGNLARFYAADALYRLGRKEEALEYFEAFDKGPDYLGASALAGEAAVHEDLGNNQRAAELYRQAALIYENDLTSPEYLLSAARNYEAVEDYSEARSVYELIVDRFPESDVAEGIEFYEARLDALDGRL
jgi:tetratricopeptide (TPR) repeat protein